LVAAGASVALLGLLLIAFRAHPLAPVLGFLSSQNGLVMLAGAQSELALPTALAVALPLVPALVLAESWQRQ
jgi:hydrogenase-4 membrane subunit HyfE